MDGLCVKTGCRLFSEGPFPRGEGQSPGESPATDRRTGSSNSVYPELPGKILPVRSASRQAGYGLPEFAGDGTPPGGVVHSLLQLQPG